MTLLALRGVACIRGGRLVFAGLDLRLDAGDAALVTGPNGVGKSSLLRLAAGLLRPAAGEVRATRAALLDERAALDAELPLAAALRFWAMADGTADRIPATLDRLALADLAAVPMRLLSTGQRRRAALARVAIAPARLWLLDEPTNGLDTAAIGRLEALIADHRAGGGAVLVATHQPLDVPGAATLPLQPAEDAA